MRLELACHIGTRPVDGVDQLRDLGCHDEEVSRFLVSRIPVRVRSSPGREDTGACSGDHFLISETKAEFALQHIPRLVVGVMDVERRDPVLADLGRPLRDQKVTGHITKRTARQSLDVLHPAIMAGASRRDREGSTRAWPDGDLLLRE